MLRGHPRSLRTRLVLLFAGITFASLGALYLYVVPQLESRLRDEKLRALSVTAQRDSAQIRQTVGASTSAPLVAQIVTAAGLRSGTRVTLLRVARAGGQPQLAPIADSAAPAAGLLSYPPALEAARSGRVETGTESSPDGRLAEAALPISLPAGGAAAAVVVFSSPLSDVQRNVTIVRRQILAAGAIALLLALVAGGLVARALAARVRKLERAAQAIAAGDFAEPIEVDVDDELGQLARAFNDMQGRLASFDRARKQFIATASHELRTPLFSLGGFVELLEDEELDDEDRARFLRQVREQVERLRKLSVDLLDLSRLDAGSLELRPESVDLTELARAVTGEFEPALARHDSHLELRVTRRPVQVNCDPVRVAQIMRILIDNALTHTPAGTNVVVSTAAHDGRVRVAVRDDGGGIETDAQGRIFEPFYTADDAQGSGLGLAIASELAEAMAGHLDVESRPGETVFTLEIPA